MESIRDVSGSRRSSRTCVNLAIFMTHLFTHLGPPPLGGLVGKRVIKEEWDQEDGRTRKAGERGDKVRKRM